MDIWYRQEEERGEKDSLKSWEAFFGEVHGVGNEDIGESQSLRARSQEDPED